MVVYFVQRPSDSAIKIGYTNSLASRISALKSQLKEEVSLLRVIPGEVSTEKQIQMKFRSFRINPHKGDWFYPNDELISYIVDLLSVAIDPAEALAANKATTIKISKTLRDRVAKFGYAGESFDVAIGRALDIAEDERKKKQDPQRAAEPACA